MNRDPDDLPRITLAVLALALLIAVTLWVLRPFLGPMVWATMVVVATWPLLLRVQRWVGGRRAVAVAVMTLLLLLLFVVPLLLAVLTVVQNADQLLDWARMLAAYRPEPQAPTWVQSLPLVGGWLARLWEQALTLGLGTWLQRLTPYAGSAARWLVTELGSVGMLLLQILLTILIAGILYAHGEAAGAQARRFAQRLAGAPGAATVQLAGNAIRAVALGVGVTALVQALLGGVALAIADIPFAGLLTALMLLLCIAQLGAAPVLVPAMIWLFYDDRPGWAVFVLVCTVVVMLLDNVLRPVLIRMGADLPLLLIFAGVIGGLLAFGLIGIFAGPVVLAVAYMLFEAWVVRGEPSTAAGHSPPPTD